MTARALCETRLAPTDVACPTCGHPADDEPRAAESNEDARWLADQFSARAARERVVGRAFAALAVTLVIGITMVLALR